MRRSSDPSPARMLLRSELCDDDDDILFAGSLARYTIVVGYCKFFFLKLSILRSVAGEYER